jgi:diguanylate cyclase (GGDEF)-like protein
MPVKVRLRLCLAFMLGLLCSLVLVQSAQAVQVVQATPASSGAVALDAAQRAWIDAHKDQVLSVGFDPEAGLDSFVFQGRRIGLLPALLDDMQVQLGLRLQPADVRNWDDAYGRFLAGKIDLLYGANPTPEREKVMRFTRAAQQYPYVVFARKDSVVQTLGDLDGRKVGFIANDFVIERLPAEFPNVHVQVASFEDQREGLKALAAGEVDGFVTAGGGVEYEFLNDFPALILIAEIKAITSDMTFAVAKERAILAQIIDRYLDHRRLIIQNFAREARRNYNRKVLRLSEAELGWLAKHGEAVVGVAEDYLPFDFYDKGEYKGIAGATLDRIGELIGVRFKVVSGSFAKMLGRAQAGEVHVLNLAKTEERQQHFLFPPAISTERDIIVGLKSSPPVQDVYGLDGRRVAVIDGFWHEEYLRKNLKNPNIVKTADIMASLRLLRAGKVDYVIENPTVLEFYINGLGYTELVKRGNTSKDSFIYFGVSRQQPELASILGKVIPLIQFEEMKYLGMQTVPTLRNEANRQLTQLLAALAAALLVILMVTLRTVRKLAEQKAKTQFLHEREHLLYTDSLTGFHNRNYFSQKADTAVNADFPQAIVVADMNNLKRVNDSHGHAAGDALIKAFAAAARAQWPQAEHFRIGGDEFLFILPGCSEQQVLSELLALNQRCQQACFEVAPGLWVSPSAAMGYALRVNAQSALQACMAEADARMYAAKAGMKKRSTDE